MRSPMILVALACASPAAAEPTGRVRVTVDGATDDDTTKLRAIAKNLEGAVTWRSGDPKRTKKFRLRVHARGGVRGLTELHPARRSTDVTTDDDHPVDGLVICKLVRNRLWSARLRGAGAARTVTVTFTFTPR